MESEAAAEAANPSMAKETLDEWMKWRERMRAQDRLHADLEAEQRRQDLAEEVRRAAYRPDAPQRAADAAKPFDTSDIGGRDRRLRANKTGARLIGGSVGYRPGMEVRAHRRVGDKPVATSERDIDDVSYNTTGAAPFARGVTVYSGRTIRSRSGWGPERYVTTENITSKVGRRRL